MRYLLQLSSFLLFLLVCNKPIWAQINLSSGLVGYYTFSGNPNEASGNGFNGITKRVVLTTDRFGTANSAYLFDPFSFIYVDDFFYDQEFKQISYSLWFLSTGNYNSIKTDTYGFMLIGMNDDGFYGNQYEDQVGVLNQYGQSIDQWGFQFSYWHPTYSYTNSVAPLTSVPNNRWFHVAAVRTGAYLRLYLDGVLQNEITYTYKKFNGEDLMIGAQRDRSGKTSRNFVGKIDDIRVYNRALTKEEIDSLSNDRPKVLTSLEPESNTSTQWIISPNPVSSELTIFGLSSAHVSVCDHLGAQVKEMLFSETNVTVPFDDLPCGVYHVNVISEGKKVGYKVLKNPY